MPNMLTTGKAHSEDDLFAGKVISAAIVLREGAIQTYEMGGSSSTMQM
jgi:hypothetical protein